MTEWKECKLGDVVFFSNGKSRPDTSGYIPIYGGNGILEYTDQSNNDGETIIIGRVGAYCGSVYYENRPVWVSDNALAAKPKEQYYAKYLYYLLKFSDLNQYAEGSSHPLLTQSLLNSIDIVFCDNIDEQKAIAEVLSSLDDKIDLLTRQNKTLEDVAQAYFRKWFIEDASDEWEDVNLSSFIDYTIGGDWGKEKLIDGYDNEVLCIRGTDIGNFSKELLRKAPVRFIKKEKLEKCKLIDGDIVIEISGGSDKQSTGRAIYINKKILSLYKLPIICSNFCRVLRPKNRKHVYFVYEYLKYLYNIGEFFNYENGTSGIRNLALDAVLNEIHIKIPPKYLLNEKNELFDDLYKKQQSNNSHILTLQKLRDTLLPKLISGEIRLKM
jgi:type I restriction enzyme S subunit